MSVPDRKAGTSPLTGAAINPICMGQIFNHSEASEGSGG